MRSLRITFAAVLLALAGGCATAGRAGPEAAAPGAAACAAFAQLADTAYLDAAFDSLYTLALARRKSEELVLTPHDAKPRLANRTHVARLLQDLYPPALRDAGLGGSVEVAMLLDAAGTPRRVRVVRGSGSTELDRATVAVVNGMRFHPARNGGCPVPFMSIIPVRWTLERT